MPVEPAITIQVQTLKVCPECYGSSIYERVESYRSINTNDIDYGNDSILECSDCGEIKTTTNQQRVIIDMERNRAELLLDVLDTYEQLESSENNDNPNNSAENLQLVDEMLEQLRQRLAVRWEGL